MGVAAIVLIAQAAALLAGPLLVKHGIDAGLLSNGGKGDAHALNVSVVGYVLLGLAVAGLTFFLFYVGVGGFDNTIVDGLVNATAYVAGFFGLVTRRVQTGKVQTYLVFVILGVMIFFLWFR
jgi:hypothetical protein